MRHNPPALRCLRRVSGFWPAAAALALAAAGLQPALAQPRSPSPLQLPPAHDHRAAFAALGAGLSPQARVVQALREAGHSEALIASLQFAPRSHGNRWGVSFVRALQHIDGLPVHGSYLRAAIDSQGRVQQLLTRLVPVDGPPAASTSPRALAVPAGAATDEAAGAAAALQAVRARGVSGPMAVPPAAPPQRQGQAWRFARAAADWAEPQVTRVWLPLPQGLVPGWKVETHLRQGNRAQTTLVGPGQQVLQVVERGSHGSFRHFPNSPAAGPTAITYEAANPASPRGWVDLLGQTSLVLFGNNAIVGLDHNGDNDIDGGGYPIQDGQFLSTPDLGQSPLTARNQQFAVQNAFTLVNRIHDTVHALGFTETAGNLQRDNFGRGGVAGDGLYVTVQDWNADGDGNLAVSYEDGGFARMQIGLQPSPLPTHEVQVAASGWTAGAKLGLFGPGLDTRGLSGTLVRPAVADGCQPLGVALNGAVALLNAGPCAFATAVLNAQQAGARAVVIASPAPANHAFRMRGNVQAGIPSVQVGAADAQRLAGQLGQTVQLRAKAQQPPLIDGALDADLVFHEYAHAVSARLIGDVNSSFVAAAINEAYSDTIAFLMTGNDRFAAYAFSESCFRLPGSGCRRAAWSNYPGRYGDLRARSIYDDSEIYTAAVWRLKELMGDARRHELLGYVIDGMNYTPPTPDFEQARDGLLAAVANGPQPADCALVWQAFAQFGLGQGSSASWTHSSVTTRPSSVAPAQCRP